MQSDLYYYFIPMENKLEQLLNSLIEKGWKPFDWANVKMVIKEFWVWKWYFKFKGNYNSESFDLRQIVSKESWLWQFCIENWLVELDQNYTKKWTQQFHRHIYDEDCWIENNNLHNDDYEYRLIESALKDESELEDFLLQNIKVWNED